MKHTQTGSPASWGSQRPSHLLVVVHQAGHHHAKGLGVHVLLEGLEAVEGAGLHGAVEWRAGALVRRGTRKSAGGQAGGRVCLKAWKL